MPNKGRIQNSLDGVGIKTMKEYLIGTDIGTSSTKSIITDLLGNVIASANESYGLLTPHNAWAEQWPDVWLTAAKKTIHDVVNKSGVKPEEVRAISISGLYGGSGIPLDENMNPVRPCIIWMDRRTETMCTQLRNKLDIEKIFSITENGIDSYFGFTKILWIKEHEPENWNKIKLFLTPNQYVIYKITGKIAMDRTSAGNLGGVYDYEAGTWSTNMLDTLEIPLHMLPEKLVEPHEIVGGLTTEAGNELLLAPGTPVCAGCIDCLASTLATGSVKSGQHVIVLSTSLNWGLIHDKKPHDPKYISMPYLTDSTHMRYTYGGISTAGALTRWFKETIAPSLIKDSGLQLPSFETLEEAAGELPAGSEGLILLPYFMGERSPIWDSGARGMLMGLTLKHTSAHIYRAILESIGYAMLHITEDYYGKNDKSTLPYKIVGGASSSRLWIQILSDITGQIMEHTLSEIEAPWGNAFIAGKGIGLFTDYGEISRWAQPTELIYPIMENHERYSKYFEIYKELYLSSKEQMHRLAELSKN